MSYASELLDGFNESLSLWGSTITPVGSTTPVPVIVVDAELSVEMLLAGNQPRGEFNFEIARATASAAGIAPDSCFTVPDRPGTYQVLPIEGDLSRPVIFVSANKQV